MLKTNLVWTDSSTNTALIVAKYNEIDNGGIGDGKLVEKSSKVKKPQ